MADLDGLADFFRGKRVFITGHTGFKGSWLSAILLKWGAQVTGYALAPHTDPSLFTILGLSDRMRHIVGDTRDRSAVMQAMRDARPQIVFHLAAQPIVRESYDDPAYTYETNVIGTLNVLEAVRAVGGVQVGVMITTDKVYENKEWVWPYRESDELGGYDPYSASKACAELIIRSHTRSFFKRGGAEQEGLTRIAAVRAGNVIGGGDWSRDRLVPDIVRSILEKGEELVLRSPEAVRPWQHVLEPLSGYLLVAKELWQGKDAYSAWNFAPSAHNFITVQDLVKRAIAILEKGTYRVVPEAKKHEATLLTLDSQKARQGLGWEPKLSCDQTLGWTFDWYKRHYEGGDMKALVEEQIDEYFGPQSVEHSAVAQASGVEDRLGKILDLVSEHVKETVRPLPADKVPVSGKVYDSAEVKNLVEAALEGWWTEGKWNDLFEKKIREFLGVRFALTVNSGSSANLVALKTLTSKKLGDRRIKKGDEVITVAGGFPTTVNPIIEVGAVPVFVDVELGTYNASMEMLEKAISEKTKAIFMAHTLGNPFDAAKVRELCDKHGLWMIEDNCDALGSKLNGRYTGTFGDLATVSFYPAHQVTTAEGGVVLMNKARLHVIARSIRDWGRNCWCPTGKENTCEKRFSWQLGTLPFGYDHKYTYSEIGYNLKMTDLQAAIGVAQMDKLEGFIKKRRANFSYLHARLRELEDLFILPKALGGAEPCWFGFTLTIKDPRIDRTELTQFLVGRGVATRLLFGGNLTRQPYFIDYEIPFRQVGVLDNTDVVMNKTFWIGVYPRLENRQLDYAIDCIKEFLEQKGLLRSSSSVEAKL